MSIWAGTRESIDKMQAFFGLPFREAMQPEALKVENGEAIINLRGVMNEDAPDWLCAFADVVKPSSVVAQVEEAASRVDVNSIRLSVDSPGGNVKGVATLANAVYLASALKPVIADVEGDCCSAAYWVASQANTIQAQPTSMVGSIGAFIVLDDSSASALEDGHKIMVVATGEAKGFAEGAPIPQAKVEEAQNNVNALMELFVADIERTRGTVPEAVKSGRVWLASAATGLGLVDAIIGGSMAMDEKKKEEEMEEEPKAEMPEDEEEEKDEEEKDEEPKAPDAEGMPFEEKDEEDEEKKEPAAGCGKKKPKAQASSRSNSASFSKTIDALRAAVEEKSAMLAAANAALAKESEKRAQMEYEQRINGAVASGKLSRPQLFVDNKPTALAVMAKNNPAAFDAFIEGLPAVAMQTMQRTAAGVETKAQTKEEKVMALAEKLASERKVKYYQVIDEARAIVAKEE